MIDLLARIRAARSAGETITGTRDDFAGSVESLAAEFGLGADPDIYRSIARTEAIAVLEAVLHRDLAYASEIVPAATARRLAIDFVACFAAPSTRFYTNGTYGLPRVDPRVGPEWQPATDATFDTGVLVLARPVSACLWFADED